MSKDSSQKSLRAPSPSDPPRSRRAKITARESVPPSPSQTAADATKTPAPRAAAMPEAEIRFERDICGHLDSAISREWLVTNGIGGFASGTVAGSDTTTN